MTLRTRNCTTFDIVASITTTLIAFHATISSSFRFPNHDGVAHSCTIVQFRLQLYPVAVFPIDFVTVVQPFSRTSSYISSLQLQFACTAWRCRLRRG